MRRAARNGACHSPRQGDREVVARRAASAHRDASRPPSPSPPPWPFRQGHGRTRW